MAVLKNNEYKIAIWGAKNSFITGLDPLGLQNTSEATYSYLLSGVTNLTNRIRYYGFFCWLLEYYAKHIRETNPKSQYDFIRKAELMLAIIMKSKNPSYTQVTGSAFATDLIYDKPSEFFDLEKNAVQTGDNKTYWKYSSGSFGQYYAGAMSAIGLTISADNNNFICTNQDHHKGITGVEVARAFEENVSESVRSIFIHNIMSGKLPVNQIETLYEEIALSNIESDSTEWSIYINMLLQKDLPVQEEFEEAQITYHRRNTIKYLLESIKEFDDFNGWSFFTKKVYINKGELNGETSETLKIWHFYTLNELWYFGSGTVFWGMLMMLNKHYNSNVHLPLFVNELTNNIVSYLEDNFDIKSQNPLHEELIKILVEEDKIDSDIKKAIKQEDYYSSLGMGMALILSIYNTNEKALEEIQKIAYKYGIIRDGNVLDFIISTKNCQDTIFDFVHDFILRNIIYRHQYVALRKTGSGSLSSLKFLLEENYIRQIDLFEPAFGSPRLDAVLNMMKDLGLIDKEDNITQKGISFLKTVLNGDS